MGMLPREASEQPDRSQGGLPDQDEGVPPRHDGGDEPALPADGQLRAVHSLDTMRRARFRWRWAYKVIRRIFRWRKYFWQLGELLKTFKDVKPVPKSRPK